MLESGITYFKGASFPNEAITSNSWVTSVQAVEPPTSAGKVFLSKESAPFDFSGDPYWATEDAMSQDLGLGALSSAGTSNVALLIQAKDQSSSEPTVISISAISFESLLLSFAFLILDQPCLCQVVYF